MGHRAQQESVISRDARTNRRIRARELRVIGPEGEQLGVLTLEAALARAMESGLDLVEVNPMAKPPVCKIMDYGKFKYETKKRANEAKKKQVVIKTKEIKMRPRTEEHDYNVKLRQAREFLEEGHKIKVTIVFRGREIAHREIGQSQLMDMVNDLKDVAVVEQSPRMEGRAMFLLLGANPRVKAAAQARSTAAGTAAPAPAPAAAPAAAPAGAPAAAAPAAAPAATAPAAPASAPAPAAPRPPSAPRPTFQGGGSSQGGSRSGGGSSGSNNP